MRSILVDYHWGLFLITSVEITAATIMARAPTLEGKGYRAEMKTSKSQVV